MTEERKCEICSKSFVANKYRPNQSVCSSVECQYQRQLANMAKWRGRNPNYFRYKETRDSSWRDTCRSRSLEWRKKHKEYLKLYRDAHKERHRNYMRDYMREYRKRKNLDQGQAEKGE